MATGLPDYLREIRPVYGGGIASAGELVVTANTLNELLEVIGKGMVYGGYLYLDYSSTQKGGVVKLEIDGEIILGEDFQTMVKYGVKIPRSFVASLLAYDDVNFVYAVGLSYGMTFEQSLKLYYHEMDGATPTLNYRVVYALI